MKNHWYFVDIAYCSWFNYSIPTPEFLVLKSSRYFYVLLKNCCILEVLYFRWGIKYSYLVPLDRCKRSPRRYSTKSRGVLPVFYPAHIPWSTSQTDCLIIYLMVFVRMLWANWLYLHYNILKSYIFAPKHPEVVKGTKWRYSFQPSFVVASSLFLWL